MPTVTVTPVEAHLGHRVHCNRCGWTTLRPMRETADQVAREHHRSHVTRHGPGLPASDLPEVSGADMTKPRQTVTHMPVTQLTAHPGNIRDDLGDLAEMAASIREHGILQPLTCTEHPTRAGVFVLLAGHRRLKASLMTGLADVPVIIRHGLSDPAEQLVVMLVENTHRRDLAPVERAQAYGALRNQGLTQSEIARRTGTGASVVNYYLNLLDLDEESLEEVRTGRLNSTDAIAAVRDARQVERVQQGAALRGRPKMTPQNLRGGYFNVQHRLAPAVRRMCNHRSISQVGNVGCGPCWEAAIVAEDEAAREAANVDPVLVAEFLAADTHRMRALAKRTTKADKHAITDAWLDSGRSWNELERIVGWNHGRYGRTRADVRQEAAS